MSILNSMPLGVGIAGFNGGYGGGAYLNPISSLSSGGLGVQSPEVVTQRLAGISGMTSPNINPVGGNQAGKLGFNTDTLGLGLQGIQTLAGVWGAIQQASMAKKAFKFQKEFALKNLENQTQTYNTALTDRANTRAVMEGRDQASADSYIAANRLKNLGG